MVVFQLQLQSLAEAFDIERDKVKKQQEQLQQSKSKIKEKKSRLIQDKKVVEKAAKSLAMAEQTFQRKLDDLNSIIMVL